MGEQGLPRLRRVLARARVRRAVVSVLVATFTAVLGAVLYWSTLSMEIVGGDLYPLLESSAIRSWTDVEEILTSRLMAGTGVPMPYYRPVASFSYSLGYAIWGLEAMGHHAMNVAVFAGAVLATYVFSRSLGGSTLVSGLAAGLFATHPLFMELVPLADHRMDLLVTLFGLLAFSLFVQAQEATSNSRWWHAGALLCFLAALGSKEPALALVPLFVLYPLLTGEWGPPWRQRLLASLRTATPYIALSAAWMVVRSVMIGTVNGRWEAGLGFPWTDSLVEAVAAVSLKYTVGLFPPLVTAGKLLGPGLYPLGHVTGLAMLAGLGLAAWGLAGRWGSDVRAWPSAFTSGLRQRPVVQRSVFLFAWLLAGWSLMVGSLALGPRTAALFVPALCLLVAMGVSRLEFASLVPGQASGSPGLALLAVALAAGIVVFGPAGAGDLGPVRAHGEHNAAALEAVDDTLEAPAPNSHLDVLGFASSRPDRGRVWPPGPLTLAPYKGATVTSWLHLTGTQEISSTTVHDDPMLDPRTFSSAELESSSGPQITVRLIYEDGQPPSADPR